MDTVNWHALPGAPGVYRPELVEPNLHDLDSATRSVDAARAAGKLADGGLLHDHSGVTLPAVAAAAPRLLEIVDHGHPAARNAAISLLDDAIHFRPIVGYGRFSTESIYMAPICSLLAHQIRGLDKKLGTSSPFRRELIDEVNKHWLFRVDEMTVDGGDIIAYGALEGVFPEDGAQSVECHSSSNYATSGFVSLEFIEGGDSNYAYVRIIDLASRALPESGVWLLPAACGEKLH